MAFCHLGAGCCLAGCSEWWKGRLDRGTSRSTTTKRDVQLTQLASTLYRLLGVRIGNGYDTRKSRHRFRDLINASATVAIGEEVIAVRFQRRAHNRRLVTGDFDQTDATIPWLGGKRLRLVFR